PRSVAPRLAEVVAAARADAARRTGVAAAQLQLISADAVTWPDGSLGCPAPGRMYTQALVPGYRVRIAAAGQVLNYHASEQGLPALCPSAQAREPLSGASRQ
ncbi:MAG: hypothetical protein Q8L92_16635, partial [Rubrivivax sp.]|nr:hypothetical protein [Rubrivivax sp.]